MAIIRGLTTINTKASKKNSKKTQAQIDHEKWLRSRGFHSSQLKKKVDPYEIPNYKCDKPGLSPMSNNIAVSTKAEKLTVTEINDTTKKFTIAQPYSKGPYMVIPNKDDIKTIGKKV